MIESLKCHPLIILLTPVFLLLAETSTRAYKLILYKQFIGSTRFCVGMVYRCTETDREVDTESPVKTFATSCADLECYTNLSLSLSLTLSRCVCVCVLALSLFVLFSSPQMISS